MKKLVPFILLILTPFFTANSQSFADGWEYVGVAVEEPGYTVWGSHSDIAHYVGDSPEGPFHFSDVALQGMGKGHWDASGPHNPAIHRVNDEYYLLYIANDNPKQPPHPANQQIGLAKSQSLFGPWERINGDGLLLSPPTNPKYWNYEPTNGVNNPALLQHPDGGFFLYFKSEGGNIVKFERPQVLSINDKVTYMYAPSGYHFFGKEATASYVLRRTEETSSEKNLKIISYNIWNGFDWGKDTARQKALADWLKSESPDVVALQELCNYDEARLRKEAAMWGHTYVSLLKESGYSVGITSNKPIRVKEKMREGLHHGALHAETHGIDFLVIHLHPGNPEFRKKEVEILMEKIDYIRRRNDNYIVLGDFNEQSPLDAEMYNNDNTFGKGKQAYYHVLSRFLSNPLVDLVDKSNQPFKDRGSFPGLVLSTVQDQSIESLRQRLNRIDFIMASPQIARGLQNAAVIKNKTTDWLSDHYPVVANIRTKN